MKEITDPLARFDYMLTPDDSRPEERMVTKFDPPDRQPSFIRRWSGGARHLEHMRELEEANKTRNDPLEVEGKHQDFVDVNHRWEVFRGNIDHWDSAECDRWLKFRQENTCKDPLPTVKFNVAVKSIV